VDGPPGVIKGLAHALERLTYAKDGLRHALARTLDGRLALGIGVLPACVLVRSSRSSAADTRAGRRRAETGLPA
jgi:hypothetical protein